MMFLGLQVSVHDACSVCLFKPVRHLCSDAEQLDGLDRTRGEQFPQRRSRNVLHDQIVNIVLASYLVDRHDVRVVQRGSGARLALEPLETGRIREHIWPEDFNGDVTAQLKIASQIHRPHASLSEERDDLKRTQVFWWRRVHVWGRNFE